MQGGLAILDLRGFTSEVLPPTQRLDEQARSKMEYKWTLRMTSWLLAQCSSVL